MFGTCGLRIKRKFITQMADRLTACSPVSILIQSLSRACSLWTCVRFDFLPGYYYLLNKTPAAVSLDIPFQTCRMTGCRRKLVYKPPLKCLLYTVSKGVVPVMCPSLYCNGSSYSSCSSTPLSYPKLVSSILTFRTAFGTPSIHQSD